MSDIIENVRANEQVNRDFEVVFRRNYRLGKPTTTQPEFVKSANATSRFVYQNGMIYHRNDETQINVGGTTFRPDVLLGYDGNTMRSVMQNAVANIADGPFRYDAMLFRPHTMTLRYVFYPLSTYLQGGAAVRKVDPKNDVRTQFEKEEELDGLHCFKIRIETRSTGRAFSADPLRFVWLAPERNYLPVRTEFYNLASSANWNANGVLPDEIGEASDFREIAPSVWLPFRTSLVVYDSWAYAINKTRAISNAEDRVVDKAGLDPHYDIKLFRDIPFPDGASVYEIKNGKILKSYTQGGRGASFNRKTESKTNLGLHITPYVGME
jgi:hypothetical protein